MAFAWFCLVLSHSLPGIKMVPLVSYLPAHAQESPSPPRPNPCSEMWALLPIPHRPPPPLRSPSCPVQSCPARPVSGHSCSHNLTEASPAASGSRDEGTQKHPARRPIQQVVGVHLEGKEGWPGGRTRDRGSQRHPRPEPRKPPSAHLASLPLPLSLGPGGFPPEARRGQPKPSLHCPSRSWSLWGKKFGGRAEGTVAGSSKAP